MIMSRHRDSPVRHNVKTHKREGQVIHTYIRGHGQRDVYKSSHLVAIPQYLGLQKEEIAFKFSPKMIATLGGSLYKRKVEAALREPIQNALDSGTSTVDIYLKNMSNGKVLVQVVDNGKGLTKAEIEKYIATIGETSKAGDKGKVGKFGIGKLAPFMVADETYIVTSKGDPMQKLYVGVSQTGLTIEKGMTSTSELAEKIRERNVWQPVTRGTTVAFVLDTNKPEFRALIDENDGLGIDSRISPKEQIRRALQIIVGPVKKTITLNDLDSNKVDIITKFWSRSGAIRSNLRTTSNSNSETRVYSNGLYIQKIESPFITGEIDYNLREAISLNREEIKKETKNQIRSWNTLASYINRFRDKNMGDIASGLGSWQLTNALQYTRTPEAKKAILDNYRLSILEGSVRRNVNLASIGYRDTVMVIQENEFEGNRNQLERYSQSTGIKIVIGPDDNAFIRDSIRYLKRKGATIVRKRVSQARKREKHWELRSVSGKYKELSDEIKRLYGLEFGWAIDTSPNTIAYALSGKIYMNKNSDFMKELVEAKVSIKDKALYMLGTTAHEWAHVQSGAQGHEEIWRQTMESLKYDLVKRGLSVSDPYDEGKLMTGRGMKISGEIANSDSDGQADLAWVGNRLIAKIGRYDITVKGKLRRKGKVGHGHDNIKDGKLNFPTPLEYDPKQKSFGSFTILERPYDSDKELTKGTKVKVNDNGGIWSGWEGTITGKEGSGILDLGDRLVTSPAHVIKFTKDSKGGKVASTGNFFANQFNIVD